MRYRQETIVEKDWDGEFKTYDEWARLGPQPRTGVPFFWMVETGLASPSKILLGRETITLFP
jgi:hypothetical protein